MPNLWKIAPRAAKLSPSVTLSMDSKAKALLKQGVQVVNFSVGEPDFPTPSSIAEAGIQAIRTGKTRYTPPAGIMELRTALRDKLQNENHLDIQTNQVMVTHGTKQALHNALQVLLNEGDEVIVLAPYWVSYTELILLSQGTAVIVNTCEKMHPVAKFIEQAVTPRTKGILVNSPNNPTGAVYSEQELGEIAKIATAHGLWILSDEVYEKLVFSPAVHISPAEIFDKTLTQTIVVNALSKSFSMTGWRLGYLAGPKEIVEAASNVQSHATGNPNTPAQYAALAALQAGASAYQPMVDEYQRRREVMIGALNQLAGVKCPVPQGAFYAFANFSQILNRSWKGQRVQNSLRLAEILLENFHVATVPGIAFGAEGFLRLSFATSEEKIKAGIQKIGDFINALD